MSAQRRHAPEALKEALSRLPASAWTPFERTEDYVRYYTMIDVGGVQTRAEKTEFIEDETLQKLNAEQYNDSLTRRFGDGKVVARIPMNLMCSPEFTKRITDRDFMKWWLNSEAARPFRTFRGKI